MHLGKALWVCCSGEGLHPAEKLGLRACKLRGPRLGSTRFFGARKPPQTPEKFLGRILGGSPKRLGAAGEKVEKAAAKKGGSKTRKGGSVCAFLKRF